MNNARIFLPLTRDQKMTLNAYLMAGDAEPLVYGYSDSGAPLFVFGETALAQETSYLVVGPVGTLQVDLGRIVLRVRRRDGSFVDVATWSAGEPTFEIASAGVVVVRCRGLDDTLAAAFASTLTPPTRSGET